MPLTIYCLRVQSYTIHMCLTDAGAKGVLNSKNHCAGCGSEYIIVVTHAVTVYIKYEI